MIDIRDLREHPQNYKKSAKLRGLAVDIDELLKLDEAHRERIKKVDALRSELNSKSKPSEEELKELQAKKEDLAALEKQLQEGEQKYQDLLTQVPNLIADDTPEGGEEANRQERTWGEAKPKRELDHAELAEQRGWLDFERGAKVAGSKFYFLQAEAVKLEMAVMRFAMDLIEKEGFVPMSVPHLVNTKVAAGAGFLPRGEERQIYKIEDEDLNLIATAEMPLTGYHADEIIDLTEGPKLYAGISPCYRLEAGAYGKHSKGLYRVHQFDKLEMYVFCKPEDSDSWLEKLAKIEEKIYQELDIPYRVVRIATGDLGAPHYKKYDLEYWSPADNAYREITSCSNCTDYQARRLGIRYRTPEGKPAPVHTLNGTAVAFSRVFIALLENHQTKDGKVHIPKALQPYYGKDEM